MTPDSMVSRREPRLPGRVRTRRVLVRRILALFLLPFMVTGGVPVRRASAQPMAPPTQTTSAADGQTIQAIEMRGIQALSEETLLFYLGLQPGQVLDDAQLNKKIKELWDRSLVDDIQVEAEPAQGGVKLIITVKERPILRSIDYQGIKRVSKTDIQDKLSTQRIRLREGEPMSQGELERVNALIEELYAEKGYRFAEARYTVEDVGPNEKKVTFTVDEGGRVRIAEIDFEGNTVYNDIHLQYLMRNTRQSGPVTRILKKDIYDPAKLQEDLDRVRKLYRGAGYKNVVIGDPQLEVRATNPDAKPADQKRRMFITIPIEEGERWKFGEVTIEGNEIYTDQALLRLFKHRPSSWLRQKTVDDGVKAITDLYHNTGYIFARIDPELVEKPGQVADLVIHINESDQYRVGRIEFQGNDRTMDKVLRRELRLWEGGLVNIGAVRNSVLKVNQLGYFKLDEEDPVQIDTDTEKKEVNLVFKGEEADRTELQFGGGWSELDGFFGQFAVNTKNFLGRGEQVGVSFQSGRFRDFFDLSYFIPWFLDRPQTIGVRVYDQDTNFGLFDNQQRYLRNGRGAILTYGRNFRLFQSASLSYNLSKYEDEYSFVVPERLPGDPPPGPNDAPPGSTVFQKVSLNNSSLRPVYVFDSRDNPFETTRGQRFSLATEYAGGFLGGDSYFVRPEITYSLFKPTSSYPVRQVFAINVEGGLIDAFGGKQRPLQPYDRFFLGGENTIRGHRYKSIYLRDSKGDPLKDDRGFILGGDKYVQINLEYHFLLGGPFRLLAFVDGGNVYGSGQSFDLSRLRYTAGAELRVLIPMFGAPLRFIYAKNLDPQPQDSFESFQFSIGSSF
jgi:outer membrane protein insertion porin family